MRVLITGATGLLGARLVARLSNEWEVEATELERLVGELQAASAATA